MMAQKYSILFMFTLSIGCVISPTSAGVSVDNKLESCAVIETGDITELSNLAYVGIDISLNQPISECGCKSALAAYEVFSIRSDYKKQILHSAIALVKSGQKNLPITAEKSLTKNFDIQIHFSCALPD